MAISPIDVTTEGYLNSPLSVATSGYIYLATVGVIGDNPSGGSTGKTRQIRAKSVELIKRQLLEDEEILTIILVALEQDLI